MSLFQIHEPDCIATMSQAQAEYSLNSGGRKLYCDGRFTDEGYPSDCDDKGVPYDLVVPSDEESVRAKPVVRTSMELDHLFDNDIEF